DRPRGTRLERRPARGSPRPRGVGGGRLPDLLARVPGAAMTDLLLLVLALAATTAAGLLALRVLRALPVAPGERLLAGLAVGLGLAGMAGLGLAAAGQLRATPIALLGAAALLARRRALARAGRALAARALGRVWPPVLVCALVPGTAGPNLLAAPAGGR